MLARQSFGQHTMLLDSVRGCFVAGEVVVHVGIYVGGCCMKTGRLEKILGKRGGQPLLSTLNIYNKI